ncbi:MAG TPA: SpoIIE family protein phosphatase [Anaerolineaceae bacterium]|nr:SpoIIE family protein phosphatase [Anaerolineaceae bacterium]
MPDAPKSRLLVVDDDRVNRLVMQRYLETEGHQVSLAADGEEALALLSQKSFDMLLLDIEMPVMNGFQVLERMTADPLLREVPVVVVSGVEELDSVVRCIQMGAEDYLTKPVNRVLLKARIDASLEKKLLRDRQSALLKRLQREMEIAQHTQMSILPERLPEQAGYTFGALMKPARSVGGDFYDAIPMGEDRWGLVVGDVSDKGLPAALFMTLTYSLIRVEATQNKDPGQALRDVNKYLLEMNNQSMFVTVLCGLLDCREHSFHYARAGHPLPIWISPEGLPLGFEKQPSQALGLFEHPKIDEGIIHLPPHSLLVMYSDGLSEAVNDEGSQLGHTGLEARLRETYQLSPNAVCLDFWQFVQKYSGGSEQQDDFTVLAFHREG